MTSEALGDEGEARSNSWMKLFFASSFGGGKKTCFDYRPGIDTRRIEKAARCDDFRIGGFPATACSLCHCLVRTERRHTAQNIGRDVATIIGYGGDFAPSEQKPATADRCSIAIADLITYHFEYSSNSVCMSEFACPT